MSVCRCIKDDEIEIIGNITPDNWYKTLVKNDGKPYSNAITILGEIVYWYRLSKSGTKKFKYDKLQKQYKDFGEKFNMTNNQVKPAIKYLVDKGIISIEFRTIISKKNVYNNMMFIGLNIEVLKFYTNTPSSTKHSNSNNKKSSTPPLKKVYYTKTTEQKITNIRSQQQQNDNLENNNNQLNNGNQLNKDNIENKELNIKENATVTDIETVKEVKEKIEKVTRSSINTNRVTNLLENYSIEKIMKYIDNYHHFKCNKHNPVGFLIKAIECSYGIPKEEVNFYQSSKPIQSYNFEQRTYTDEEFAQMYDNLEFCDNFRLD